MATAKRFEDLEESKRISKENLFCYLPIHLQRIFVYEIKCVVQRVPLWTIAEGFDRGSRFEFVNFPGVI